MPDPVTVPTESSVQDDPGSTGTGTQTEPTVDMPEFLSGVVSAEEYAAMSEKDRERISALGKRLHGDYTRKTQEVAELRRVKEQLDADPKLAEALNRVVQNPELADAIMKGTLPTTLTKSDEKAIDELDTALEQMTPKERQLIQRLIDRAAEKAAHQSKAELDDLKRKVDSLASETTESRLHAMERELATLPIPMRELGEKYRSQVLNAALAPSAKHLSIRKLIHAFSTDEEYLKASLSENSEKTKKDAEKARQTSTVKPSSTATSPETPEGARLPSRDARFKRGPVNVPDALRSIYETVKRGMT